jgi:hypothetical protein
MRRAAISVRYLESTLKDPIHKITSVLRLLHLRRALSPRHRAPLSEQSHQCLIDTLFSVRSSRELINFV